MKAQKTPVRLRKEPLLEAVWEMRFMGSTPAVSELLPGTLFKAFQGRYTNPVKLPTSNIPIQVADKDQNLRYAPRLRLENGNQAIQTGQRVVSLSCRRPYPGWSKFSSSIRELAEAVRETNLVERLERFSLKYVDLLQFEDLGLDCLEIDLKLAGYEMAQKPVQLQAQIEEDGLKHIVQVVSPAEVHVTGNSEKLRGILTDVDTIRALANGESWNELYDSLDRVHYAGKRLFFNLLKKETIEALDPEYEE